MKEERELRVVVTVPNQRVIRTNRELTDANHRYTKCNLVANEKAMKELDPYTYKVYMYFTLNQDGYTFALSRADVMERTGISKNTYSKAINELINHGYLVQSKDKRNVYDFYEGTTCTIISDTSYPQNGTQLTAKSDKRVPPNVIEIEQERTINSTYTKSANAEDNPYTEDKYSWLDGFSVPDSYYNEN